MAWFLTYARATLVGAADVVMLLMGSPVLGTDD